MKNSAVSGFLLLVALAFAACAKHEVPSGSPSLPSKITLTEVAALKTVEAAEGFAASHKLPFSRQTTEVMRRQSEQIPSSALGSEGRVWITLQISSPETTAHVYFYHDSGGHVISTIIHLEPVNEP